MLNQYNDTFFGLIQEDVQQQSASGLLENSGSCDILGHVLGPEHRGRVKGEGKYVTPSTFFNIADPHLEWEKEMGMLRKEITEMKATIEALQRERKAPSGMSSNSVHHEVDTSVDDRMEALCVKQTTAGNSPQVKRDFEV